MVSSSLLSTIAGRGACSLTHSLAVVTLTSSSIDCRWTHLYSATTVPVVPPRHDEYPRFLSAAWPYYTGAISTSVGFVLFCAMWLGGAGEEKKKKGKAE